MIQQTQMLTSGKVSTYAKSSVSASPELGPDCLSLYVLELLDLFLLFRLRCIRGDPVQPSSLSLSDESLPKAPLVD